MVDIHDSRVQAASAATAWGGVGVSKYLEAIGIHAWSDAAAMAATAYSLVLIAEWCWKKRKGRK